MINWIIETWFLIRQYRKQKKLLSNLENAQKHALLALAYWKRCEEQTDLHFEIEKTGVYVRLGR